MADEQVKMDFFKWVISTLTTGIAAGLTWLGINTNRINDLNIKMALSDERISDIQKDIKEIKISRKEDMTFIRSKWESQLEMHNKTLLQNQKLSACLIKQTESISEHGKRIGLLETNGNFKVHKNKG